jgi:hypothetical protein
MGNEWLEKERLRRPLQLGNSEPFFPGVRGLRFKEKGPNQMAWALARM